MSEEPAFPLHRIVEAILFASQKPVSFKEMASIFKGAADSAKENPQIACFAKIKPDEIAEAIRQLETELAETGRAFEVRESAAGWQLVTKADFAPWLRQLFPENRSARLSAPALETLAIIAYRQPITRADMEAVRGVAVDGVMQTLLDRGLVRIAGRAEIPGRPLLYETTQYFMEHFGLKDLDDLPNAGELRRISLPTATPPVETPAAVENKETDGTEIQPTLVNVEETAASPQSEPGAPNGVPIEESAGSATVEDPPTEPVEEETK